MLTRLALWNVRHKEKRELRGPTCMPSNVDPTTCCSTTASGSADAATCCTLAPIRSEVDGSARVGDRRNALSSKRSESANRILFAHSVAPTEAAKRGRFLQIRFMLSTNGESASDDEADAGSMSVPKRARMS